MNQVARRFSRIALLLLLLTALPAAVAAQSPLSASVDRTSLTTDDTVTLSVVVNSAGSNLAQPQLPALADFEILGTSSSTRISMVNNAVSASVGYDYTLRPTHPGDLTIGPVTAAVEGQTYATEPIVVQVGQGTGTPSSLAGAPAGATLPTGVLGQSDTHLAASVDNPAPYVGQQIAYTVRYFQATDSLVPSFFGGQPSYQPPPFTGFWSHGDAQQTNYRTSTGGRIYEVAELSTALFPTAAGAVTIDPAQLTLPGSPFQRGGTMQSNPVAVDVKPLPAGAPAAFVGAVGRYVVRAEVDTTTTDTGNPVTLRLSVVGQGNVSTAGDPVLPELTGWRLFPGKAKVDTVVKDGLVYGQRVYEHVLAPTTTGKLTIPAVEYTYFDPADSAYHTVASEPFTVTVAQGSVVAPVPVQPAAGTDSTPRVAFASKPVTGNLGLAAPALPAQPWYWLLWAMPLAALSGGFVWQRRQSYLERNADHLRSSRALKSARKAAQQARRAPAPDKATAAQIILTDFLAAKLHHPVAGLTQQAIGAALTARGVEVELVQRTLACLDALDQARFGPEAASPASADAVLDMVDAQVTALDAVLR